MRKLNEQAGIIEPRCQRNERNNNPNQTPILAPKHNNLNPTPTPAPNPCELPNRMHHSLLSHPTLSPIDNTEKNASVKQPISARVNLGTVNYTNSDHTYENHKIVIDSGSSFHIMHLRDSFISCEPLVHHFITIGNRV